MKKSAKIIAAIAATAIAGSAAIGGTLAWLTSNAQVTNTFTMGDVNMILTETVPGTSSREADGQEYAIVPGGTVAKDPQFEIDSDSEDAYLFAYINDTLKVDNVAAVDEYAMATGWTAVNGVSGLYYYGANEELTVVEADDDIPFFTSVTFKETLTADKEASNNGVTGDITVKGFLIQAEGGMDYATALAQAKTSFSLGE